MVLKETERTAIENLRTQEKSCIEKYQKYAQQAIDPELKNLLNSYTKRADTLRFTHTGLRWNSTVK